jgi:hypothetical protein
MFGFGAPRRKSALDELKERLSLPDLKLAEAAMIDFYSGRNPYEHLKGEWPVPYTQFVCGFAYALDRCKKEGIVDFQRCEVIASTTGMGMAKASFDNPSNGASQRRAYA